MAKLNTPYRGGIDPLRDHDTHATLESRLVRYGVQLSGYDEFLQPKLAARTMSDINCAHWWDANDRPLAGWAWAWPTVSGDPRATTGSPVTTPSDPGKVPVTTPSTPVAASIQTVANAGAGGSYAAPGGASPPGLRDPGPVTTPGGGPTKRAVSVLPIDDRSYREDPAFARRSLDLPKGWPGFPKGTIGLVTSGTRARSQEGVYLHCDPRLVAVNHGNDPELGSIVCDEDDDGGYDPLRSGRLQGVWRVVRQIEAKTLKPGRGASIAWQLTTSDKDDLVGYGLVAGLGKTSGGSDPKSPTKPPPVTTPSSPGAASVATQGSGGSLAAPETHIGLNGTVQPGSAVPPGLRPPSDPATGGGTKGSEADFTLALLAAEVSGPIEVGDADKDQHVLGESDGHNLNAGHIATDAFFFMDRAFDAPIEFQPRKYPFPPPYPLIAQTHLVYDFTRRHKWKGGTGSGQWRLYTEVPFVINPKPPPPAPPTKPPKEPPPTTTPSDPVPPPGDPTPPTTTPSDPTPPPGPPPTTTTTEPSAGSSNPNAGGSSSGNPASKSGSGGKEQPGYARGGIDPNDPRPPPEFPNAPYGTPGGPGGPIRPRGSSAPPAAGSESSSSSSGGSSGNGEGGNNGGASAPGSGRINPSGGPHPTPHKPNDPHDPESPQDPPPPGWDWTWDPVQKRWKLIRPNPIPNPAPSLKQPTKGGFSWSMSSRLESGEPAFGTVRARNALEAYSDPFTSWPGAVGFNVVLFRPQRMLGNVADLRMSSMPDAGAIEAAESSRPVVLRAEPFGAETAEGFSLQTGPQRFNAGTSPGGLLYIAPQLDLFDTDRAAAVLPTTTAALVVAHPSVKWAAGVPIRSSGKVGLGFQWGASASGSLVFESLDSAGAATPAVTLDPTGGTTLHKKFALAGVVSPAQITANQNDYNPANLAGAGVLRVNSDAARSVTGLAGGTDDRMLVLSNVGSFPITFPGQSTSSAAANRFASAFTLAADESVWLTYDNASARWRAVRIATGAYLGTSVVTATGSFTTSALTRKIRVRLQAGGGGGGGAASVAVSAAAGGGGSAGGYVEGEFAVSPSTGYTVVIGAAGGGGANTGGNGVAGLDATIDTGVTMRAKGGRGGTGDAGGTTGLSNPGGVAPAVSTNGDVNSSGNPGDFGTRLTGLVGASGNGGGSPFGPGGEGTAAAGAGVTPVGYGGGGGGALVLNGSGGAAGGAGAPGICVIAEYA